MYMYIVVSICSYLSTDDHLMIGRLKLKIPWKSLYSAPIVAEVDGLYAIAGPAAGELHTSLVRQLEPDLHFSVLAFKYDAEKDAKEKKERKEKQLKRIEDARKKAAEPKGRYNTCVCMKDIVMTNLMYCT